MRREISVGLAVIAACVVAVAQTQTPKDVLQEFLSAEVSGARLNASGWNEMNRFFVQPSPPPEHLEIVVVSDKYSVTSEESKNADVQFIIFFDRVFGGIDSTSLRFAPQPAELPNGSPILAGGVTPSIWLARKLTIKLKIKTKKSYLAGS